MTDILHGYLFVLLLLCYHCYAHVYRHDTVSIYGT